MRAPALRGVLHNRTVRTRIAVAYGAVFLVLGTGLLIFVNVLSRAGTQERDGRSSPSPEAG